MIESADAKSYIHSAFLPHFGSTVKWDFGKMGFWKNVILSLFKLLYKKNSQSAYKKSPCLITNVFVIISGPFSL